MVLTHWFCLYHFHRTRGDLWTTNNSLLTFELKPWVPSMNLLYSQSLSWPQCQLHSTSLLLHLFLGSTSSPPGVNMPISSKGYLDCCSAKSADLYDLCSLWLPIDATLCSPCMISSHAGQGMDIYCSNETASFYLPMGTSLILLTVSDVWKVGVRSP